MGFGTSGSALIIFTGLFLAVGTLYTATANVSEDLNEAGEAQHERHQLTQRTELNVTTATWNGAEGNLTVAINNTGETTLSVEHTDIIVDGTYVAVEEFERREVEGHRTDVWRPDEQLVLEDTDTIGGFESDPTRVKVVTETGIADVREVTEA
jgi:flagellar protein FlaF